MIVHFPGDEHNTISERFWHFSVFDGGIHYWSLFGRVIVEFDKQNSLWMCRCCRSKRNCIHKSVAKWFVYQVEPSLLSDAQETEEFDDGFPPNKDDDGASDDICSLTKSFSYPPTGAILEEMVRYQHTSKRVPSTISCDMLTESGSFPSYLIPCEEVCPVSQSPLADPCEVTNRAVVIGLTKVYSGTLSKTTQPRHFRPLTTPMINVLLFGLVLPFRIIKWQKNGRKCRKQKTRFPISGDSCYRNKRFEYASMTETGQAG